MSLSAEIKRKAAVFESLSAAFGSLSAAFHPLSAAFESWSAAFGSLSAAFDPLLAVSGSLSVGFCVILTRALSVDCSHIQSIMNRPQQRHCYQSGRYGAGCTGIGRQQSE